MTAQAALIADTIAGMKKAFSREDDGKASDSDTSIQQPSNRGNKLKRKARFVHEGQLDLPNGPRVYKRRTEHSGHRRYIINTNPRRFDADGDELEDDDVDEQADTAAAEENPYSDVRLEYLLAPLTSAAGLATHPTLSTPYFSKTLSKMAQQACDMVHKEKASLWRMKHLLTRFRGDETWVPCGAFQSDNDSALFGPFAQELDHIASQVHDVNGFEQDIDFRVESTKKQTVNNHNEANGTEIGEADICAQAMEGPDAIVGEEPDRVNNRGAVLIDVPMIDTMESTHAASPTKVLDEAPSCDPFAEQKEERPDAKIQHVQVGDGAINHTESNDEGLALERINAEVSTQDYPPNLDIGQANGEIKEVVSDIHADQNAEGEASVNPEKTEKDREELDSQRASHHMTTRRQAHAASENTTSAMTRSVSPISSVSPFVHPFFTISASAHPDRNFGLPSNEAEETRRVLLLYVQKQEEICRGAEKLCVGLLRADRMKSTVLKWAKAEAHVGEMSDGEDWYDKDEWGLEEDLKKGHEEEEDEGANQGKKTRGRRA
ncbi:MAG: hypothetical protein M1827_006521 [Pycnora praestabilis]|nr:MAG: hypothetical protein M1827_006521 [Pycnora praestabilis]